MKHTKLFNEFINESQTFIEESKMGDVHIMAGDADSFTAFRKEFMDEYGKPKTVKELKALEAWLQEIWKENESLTNEAKSEVYPEEVQKIIDSLIGIGMKKYQLTATTNYGVWFIELPMTAIHIGNLKKIEKIIPDFNIGIWNGYSGLSIRTNIQVQ